MADLPPVMPPIANPPATLDYATPPRTPIDLSAVATRQRGVIICLLLYIAVGIALLAVPKETRPVFAAAALGVLILAAVFVFMLAGSVYGTGTGMALGAAALIPWVGLVILLVINAKATKILRAHGVKVGLLGADPTELPPRGRGPL